MQDHVHAPHTASLSRIWQRAQGLEVQDGNWEGDLRALFALGLGMEPVLRFLYQQRPALPEFMLWVEQQATPGEGAEKDLSDTLDAEDLRHWREQGYVLIRAAVSVEIQAAAAAAVWNYLDADPDEPESWYRPHAGKNGMMLHLTQHEALAAVRRSPRIRKAFEQLYGTSSIYPVVDKVSFNPPVRQGQSFCGSPLHWDTSLVPPLPHRFQGLLYLGDTGPGDGAFCCVPGFHRKLENWLATLPEGSDPRQLALQLEAVPIAGKAGDFIIWHSALPHAATPNRGAKPRLVQYLTYLPDGFTDARAWR